MAFLEKTYRPAHVELLGNTQEKGISDILAVIICHKLESPCRFIHLYFIDCVAAEFSKLNIGSWE
jgi:hypothetical protein